MDDTNIDENDPTRQVRTDLWSQMSPSDLERQRDLLISRITTIQKIAGPNCSPSITNLYWAMQQGLQTLSDLIDNR